MKKILARVLTLIVLAGVGYGSYHSGLLSHLTGTNTGDTPSIAEPSPDAERPGAAGPQGATASASPAGLGQPPAGLEFLVVDYLVENLTPSTGIELQPRPQFALADESGKMYEPAGASSRLPCRLTGANVVPAGGWRRFSLLYNVPPGQPLTLQYRGLKSTATLKVR